MSQPGQGFGHLMLPVMPTGKGEHGGVAEDSGRTGLITDPWLPLPHHPLGEGLLARESHITIMKWASQQRKPGAHGGPLRGP